MNLVPNPSNRYAVGERTAGLQRDPDGALTVTIQADITRRRTGGQLAALPCGGNMVRGPAPVPAPRPR